MPLFACLLIAPVFAFQMRYSESAEGAWALRAAPLGREDGQVLAGAIKGLCFGLVLPYVMLVSGVILWQQGLHILEELPLAVVLVMVASLEACRWNAGRIPFSVVYTTAEGAGRPVAIMLVTMVAALLLATLHGMLIGNRVILALSGVVLVGTVMVQAYRLRDLRPAWTAAEL